MTFVCEQDGVPEQDLKSLLAAELATSPSVHRAYLVRVSCELDAGSHVALCLRATPDRRLLLRIGDRFREMFNASEHLDVVFVTELEECDLKRVCREFL